MLVGEGKVGVLDEAVEQAKELAHDGDQTDQGRFTVGFETLIEAAEDGVVTGCGYGGHVKHMAYLVTTGSDMPGCFIFSRVLWMGCYSYACRQLRGLDLSKFGNVSEQRFSQDRADSFDLLQALHFILHARIRVDVLADHLLYDSDLVGKEGKLTVEQFL